MLVSPAVYPSMLSNAVFSTERYNASDSSENLMVLYKLLHVHDHQHKVTEDSTLVCENSPWPSGRAVPSWTETTEFEYEQMAMNYHTE